MLWRMVTMGIETLQQTLIKKTTTLPFLVAVSVSCQKATGHSETTENTSTQGIEVRISSVFVDGHYGYVLILLEMD